MTERSFMAAITLPSSILIQNIIDVLNDRPWRWPLFVLTLVICLLAIYRHITTPECRQYLLRQGFEEALHTHAYQYVIEMLGDIFRYSPQKAFRMACEVDTQGRVIVWNQALTQVAGMLALVTRRLLLNPILKLRGAATRIAAHEPSRDGFP